MIGADQVRLEGPTSHCRLVTKPEVMVENPLSLLLRQLFDMDMHSRIMHQGKRRLPQLSLC